MRKYLLITVSVAIALCLTANSVFAESASSAGPTNLLPNASFELAFGQANHKWTSRDPGFGSATNWTDMVNPLTIKLAATGQAPFVREEDDWSLANKKATVIEEVADAPDGTRAGAIFVSGTAGPPVSLPPKSHLPDMELYCHFACFHHVCSIPNSR